MELLSDILLTFSLLALVSLASSLLAFRLGAPLLLLFLVVGLLAGASPLADYFKNPQTTFLLGSTALAVILFESGFTTPWQSYRVAAAPALTLALLGTLITAGITAAAAHYFLEMPWLQAALLGAILSSTDAAAVFFLLRTGRITIRDRVRSTLEIESGTNDPAAFLLVTTLLQIGSLMQMQGEHFMVVDVVKHLLWEIVAGLGVGWLGGRMIVAMINRLNFEPSLYPLISLIFALFVFAVADKLGGSAFLAIYVAGLVAGNSRMKNSHNVKKFHEGISWLAQLIMFLTLGMVADISRLHDLALPALALAFVLIFVARPVAALACLLPFKFTGAETGFVGWVGLRGAVSVLLALLPLSQNMAGSGDIFTITFLVVIYSLLSQGWTIRQVAEKLKLILPPQAGPAERMEFDIAPDTSLELVAYKVHPDSLVATGHDLPYWSKPALVLRQGRPISLGDEAALEPHDKVYFFMDPLRLPVFDRLFGKPLANAGAEQEFFGDVVIDPSAKIIELLDDKERPQHPDIPDDLTIAEYFALRFRHDFEVGDRLQVGRFELVIRAIAEGKISALGLAIIPQDHTLFGHLIAATKNWRHAIRTWGT
ncbi:MAG: potassium/proton antiporter [Alphaproteobacteria bacterium]|nr:potassium/proton antiporter [Alphaproteobacteria bacterium]